MSGIAIAGVVVGAYGAYSSNKNAKDAMGKQGDMSAAQLAFQQQQYDRYLGLFGPTEQKLAMEAQSSSPLGYEPMQAQINTQYGAAQRNLNSAMAGRGIAGSGQDIGGMRGLAMGQANALTGAYAQGLTNRRNLGLTLTGRNQIGNAAGGVTNSMQNMGNFYGNQANIYNQAAAAGWGNVGKGMGEVARRWDQYGSPWSTSNNTPPPPTSLNTPSVYNQASQAAPQMPYPTMGSVPQGQQQQWFGPMNQLPYEPPFKQYDQLNEWGF